MIVLKFQILQLLQEKGYDCFEEIQLIDQHGSNRRADIIAINKNDTNAYIVDPTVRFENNLDDQDEIIVREKAGIYESCIPDCITKYSSYGHKNWSVKGLWFGARGTVGKSVITFFDEHKIEKKNLLEITTRVLVDTINIVHRHIYN